MIRGIDSRNELDPNRLLRDTRTIGQRGYEFFSEPLHLIVVLVSMMFGAYSFPAASFVILLISLFAFWFTVSRKRFLPFRLPKVAKKLDYNDLKPGIKKPFMARGIAYFGDEKK